MFSIKDINVWHLTPWFTASKLLNGGSQLLTCRRKLLTWSSKLLTCDSQLLTCGSQLLTWSSKLLTCGSQLLACSSKWLTCGSQLLTCSSKLLTSGSQLLTCGSQLLTSCSQLPWPVAASCRFFLLSADEPLHVPLVEYSSCVEMAPLRHLSFIPVIHSSYYLCSHTHTQQHSWSSGHRRATRKKLTLLSIHFLTTQPNIYHFPLSVFCACQFCQFLGPRNFPAWLRPYMTKAAEDKSWVGPGEEGGGEASARPVSCSYM